MGRAFGKSFTISAALVFPLILFIVPPRVAQTVEIMGAGQNRNDDLCHGSQTDRQGGLSSSMALPFSDDQHPGIHLTTTTPFMPLASCKVHT